MNAKHLRQLRVSGQPGPQRCNPKCVPLFPTVCDQGGLVHSPSRPPQLWGRGWGESGGGTLRPTSLDFRQYAQVLSTEPAIWLEPKQTAVEQK